MSNWVGSWLSLGGEKAVSSSSKQQQKQQCDSTMSVTSSTSSFVKGSQSPFTLQDWYSDFTCSMMKTTLTLRFKYSHTPIPISLKTVPERMRYQVTTSDSTCILSSNLMVALDLFLGACIHFSKKNNLLELHPLAVYLDNTDVQLPFVHPHGFQYKSCDHPTPQVVTVIRDTINRYAVHEMCVSRGISPASPPKSNLMLSNKRLRVSTTKNEHPPCPSSSSPLRSNPTESTESTDSTDSIDSSTEAVCVGDCKNETDSIDATSQSQPMW